jgi:hypothetical protein
MLKKLSLIGALIASSLFAETALQLKLLWKNGKVTLISKKQITAELKKQRGTTSPEAIKASEFSFTLKDKSGQTLLEKTLRHPGILHLDIPENTTNHSSEHKEIIQDSVVFTLIIPLDKNTENNLEFWQNLRLPEDSPAPRLQRTSGPTIQKVGDIQL